MSPKNISRKRFFQFEVKDFFQCLWQSPLGRAIDRRFQSLANVLAPMGLSHYVHSYQTKILGKTILSRPPGSLPDPGCFEQKCTQCSDCETACPYQAIHSYEGSGPFLDPNTIACRLCHDFPCIKACKEGALLPLAKGYLPSFGQAILADGKCLNLAGEDCQLCRQACPVPKAIHRETRSTPQFTEHCTGCGLCVSACPTAAILIANTIE